MKLTPLFLAIALVSCFSACSLKREVSLSGSEFFNHTKNGRVYIHTKDSLYTSAFERLNSAGATLKHEKSTYSDSRPRRRVADRKLVVQRSDASMNQKMEVHIIHYNPYFAWNGNNTTFSSSDIKSIHFLSKNQGLITKGYRLPKYLSKQEVYFIDTNGSIYVGKNIQIFADSLLAQSELMQEPEEVLLKKLNRRKNYTLCYLNAAANINPSGQLTVDRNNLKSINIWYYDNEQAARTAGFVVGSATLSVLLGVIAGNPGGSL